MNHLPLLHRLPGLWLLLLLAGPAWAQQVVVRLDSAEQQALRRHPRLRQSAQEIEEQRALKRGSFSPTNPDFLFSAPTGERWAPGVVQTIDFPTVYRRQAQAAQAGITLAERGLDVNRATVRRDVRGAYLSLQFAEAQVRQLTYQDSLFRTLQQATERLFKAGEVTALQRVSTEAEARQVRNQLDQAVVPSGGSGSCWARRKPISRPIPTCGKPAPSWPAPAPSYWARCPPRTAPPWP
jgi:cobalt-zinc-cadmium efflux system outer membrane protein